MRNSTLYSTCSRQTFISFIFIFIFPFFASYPGW